MPNGFHGSAEEWDRMEAPFRLLDEQLEQFAATYGITLIKNYHNWPGRRLDWGARIKRSIHLSRINGDPQLFSVTIDAFEDRGHNRYSKHDTVLERVPLDRIRANLPRLLERARNIVDSWKQEDLDISTPLSKMTPERLIASQLGGWVAVTLFYGIPIAILLYLLFRVASCAAT